VGWRHSPHTLIIRRRRGRTIRGARWTRVVLRSAPAQADTRVTNWIALHLVDCHFRRMTLNKLNEWSSLVDCTWRLFAFDFASAHPLSGLFLLLALLEKYRAGWEFASSTTSRVLYKKCIRELMLHATTAGFQICFAATCLSNSTASLLFCADALHVMGIFSSVFYYLVPKV